MLYLWIAIPLILVVLGILAYKLTTARFFIDLVKEVVHDLIIASIPLFKNKVRSQAEWKELRELRSIKPSELFPAQRQRLKELQ